MNKWYRLTLDIAGETVIKEFPAPTREIAEADARALYGSENVVKVQDLYRGVPIIELRKDSGYPALYEAVIDGLVVAQRYSKGDYTVALVSKKSDYLYSLIARTDLIENAIRRAGQPDYIAIMPEIPYIP